jgi:hypothetical protein
MTAVAQDVEPEDATPRPGSGPQRRFALDDAPPELQDNFMVRYFASLTAQQQADLDATFELQLQAGERYGDDAGRELADLEAGVHPLQRRPPTTR